MTKLHSISSDASSIDSFVGSKIQELRLSHGVSLDEMENTIGIPSDRLRLIENGLARINAAKLIELSYIFNKTPSWFFPNL